MSSVFQWISVMFVPVLCLGIIGYGVWKKAPVYDLFIEGVREGLEAAVMMLPFLPWLKILEIAWQKLIFQQD